MREHRTWFTGSTVFADEAAAVTGEDGFGLVSAGVDWSPGAVAVEGRPDRALVDGLVAQVRERRPRVVFGAGTGAVLDAAKLVAHEAGHEGELLLVPCDDEPWRAFARFAVVDENGARPTTGDATGGVARVVVSPRLLACLDERVVAVSALDTAVHAVESLLSRRGQPASELQAATALRVVAGQLGPALAGDGAARVQLVLAAGLAVEAFMATSLGLAHAFASPLGGELGVTHDTLNGILGGPAVAFAADSPAIPAVAGALGVPPHAAAITDALEAMLEHAGLPRTLRDHGVPWEAVEAVLPAAAASSGVRVAEPPISPERLRAFARAAWAGTTEDDAEEASWTPST